MEHTSHSFIQARTKLTAYYTGVIFCIVLIYSVFLYTAQNNDYRRIVVQQDFGRTVPRRLTLFQKRVIVKQVQELRTSFVYELIIINSVILLVGGILSYFFAGFTLNPINKAIANQENFLADASHELRTPLASMLTAIDVALRKEQKPEVYKETLTDVNDEVKRMHALLEELLLLSRMDMNQLPLILSHVSLNTIVEKVIKQVQPLAHKKGLALKQDIQTKEAINGDEQRLQQLLLILLDNSIKYTPKDGTITISVINMTYPQLIIEDTGKGVAPEKQKDIFKRFYQADHSHTGHGAGLGLAIAQSIMKLHKGKITVESTLGKGSKFICTFPKNSWT